MYRVNVFFSHFLEAAVTTWTISITLIGDLQGVHISIFYKGDGYVRLEVLKKYESLSCRASVGLTGFLVSPDSTAPTASDLIM